MGIVASVFLTWFISLSLCSFNSEWELEKQAVKTLWRDSPTPEKLPEDGNDRILESVLIDS